MIDDPTKPEFASWRSYQEFAKRVRHSRRYVFEKEVQAFLDTVLATRKDRDVKISSGQILYRAQQGVEWRPALDENDEEVGEHPCGFGPERMNPLPNRAKEGRANPAEIPILYLASTAQTAISEVRPWIGSEISLAQFKILRDLKAINLSINHGKSSFGHLTFDHFYGGPPPNAEEKSIAVWTDIDNAFSQPVTLSDDTADYVPTQILTELFRDVGYDAIIYKSQFGEKGYNIALFNLPDAEAINCAPYQVTGIDVKFEGTGNPWFSSKHLK